MLKTEQNDVDIYYNFLIIIKEWYKILIVENMSVCMLLMKPETKHKL